jgi:endo-1,4-beta-xylanase
LLHSLTCINKVLATIPPSVKCNCTSGSWCGSNLSNTMTIIKENKMSNVSAGNVKTILVLAIFMYWTIPFTAKAQTITTSQQGTNDRYFYSFWTNNTGSVSMTMGPAGNFSVNWSSVGNFVCGKGWKPGASRTVNYSGSVSGAQSMGLYGWTTNPLIEYYVADMGGGGEGENMGTVTSDGGTYTIWRHQQINQPSIAGTATFWQYKSIRQGSRTSGTITFANHINAWANYGMNLGSTWDYQILAIEGWGGSSGNADMTLSASSTSSNETQSTIPECSAVEQNYPNPFNPTTVISYQLSADSYTTLKVYNILGKEVATLVNEKKSVGRYAVQWNAAGMPSGIYFYRLQAGAYSETKKLILLK